MSKELESKEYFDELLGKDIKLPNIVNDAIEVLPQEIPYKMKLLFAIHECGVLVSNLNNKIKVDDNTLISMNLYTTMFSSSGSSKDSSINKIRGAFSEQYAYIKSKLIESAKKEAKDKCIKATRNDKDWVKYYTPPSKSLFPTLSTEEASLQQMERLNQLQVGSFNVTINELGSEMKANSIKMNNFIKAMASGYDMGNISSSLVKTAVQVGDIKSLNINLLMFSSVATLTKNKGVAENFIELFDIQMARRSLFHFNDHEPKYNDSDILTIINDSANTVDKQTEAMTNLRLRAKAVYDNASLGKTIDIDRRPVGDELERVEDMKAYDLYLLHLNYCRRRGLEKTKYSMYTTSVSHANWRAIKLAGMFAVLRGKDVITLETLSMAIQVVELFIDDLKDLQIELEKEPYELLVDYFRYIGEEGKIISVTKHKLVKEGLIQSSLSDKKLKELLELAQDADPDGIYKLDKNKVRYKQLNNTKKVVEESTTVKQVVSNTKPSKEVKTPIKPKYDNDKYPKVPISVLTYSIDGERIIGDEEFVKGKLGKEFRKSRSKEGYINASTDFSYYEKVATNFTSYAPYMFKGGIRLMENVIDPSSVIVLDVDNGSMSYKDMHELLHDYRHIIATTSNPSNEMKYRIILQLDRDIDLDNRQWKVFYKEICNTLGVTADTNINKAGMFYGYKDAKVLTNYDGDLLPTKSALLVAMNSKKPETIKRASQYELEEIYDDREFVFEEAYTATKNREIKLYKAMRKACALGFNGSMVEEIVNDIASNMIRPLPYKVVNSCIISQIHKFTK